MAKKAEKVAEEVTEVNPRIAEINVALSKIDKKRVDFANYYNTLDVRGRRAQRAFEEMKNQTAKQERELRKELAELTKKERI